MALNVVIAGASGLLGSHLSQELIRRNHAVIALVRRPTSAPDESSWDPHAGEIDQSVIDAADVVVNTAGTSLVANPYSKRWARAMRDSRVNTTRTLAEAIATADGRPAFIANNATGWYGDHGDEIVTEESDSRGDTLLTNITREWQAATDPALEAGARVCVLRTAPVAARKNPLFRIQRPLFRLGLGTRLAGGRQYFPVVSLSDWVNAAVFLAEHETANGPFNVCAPVTPTNAEYTDALASVLHRRALLSAPAAFLRLAGGPMSAEMLNSTDARPEALERAGFSFAHRDVRAVLAAEMA